MIITEELLNHLSACPGAIEWGRGTGQFGKTRREVVRAISEDKSGIAEEYLGWAASELFSAKAIRYCNLGNYLGYYRVFGDQDNLEFTSLQEATDRLEDLKYQRNASEDYLFHIQARNRVGEDGYTAVECSIDGTIVPEAEYYSTFNPQTGLYEDFSTYSEALLRCMELRTSRSSIISTSYRLQRKLVDNEGNTSWDFDYEE